MTNNAKKDTKKKRIKHKVKLIANIEYKFCKQTNYYKIKVTTNKTEK